MNKEPHAEREAPRLGNAEEHLKWLAEHPAPSAASGLLDHDHEVMFTLKMSCEHDERHQALALRTWLPAIERWYNELRSRPAQGDGKLVGEWLECQKCGKQCLVGAHRESLDAAMSQQEGK